MAIADDSSSRRGTTRVDITKVDYTIRDWDDTDDLKAELENKKGNTDHIIKTIDDHGAGLRPVIHVLGRAPGGNRVHVRVHGVEPYFYVPYDEFDESLQQDSKVTGWEKGFENIQGKHMVRVYTRIPGDVPKLRDEYEHHEADIMFPNRFLIDAGIEGSIRIPDEHATAEPTDVLLEDISDCDYNQSSRVCFCDIEVDDSKGFPDQDRADREILSITVYDNYREDYQIFLYHPDFPEVGHEEAKVRMYEDEASMLKAFCRYVRMRDFDVITGWNFTDFDSRFIVNRIDNLSDEDGVEDLDKNDLSNLGSAYDDSWYGAKIKGMTVFDMLKGYKNLQFTELDSYSLEDVAQEELGTGKIKDTRGVHELWEEEPQKLVDYNVKDVKLTVELEEEQDIIKFYEEIANYVGGRLGEVIDASKAVDIKVLRAVNGRWAVPSAKNVETEEFEGGKVFNPITGVEDYVAVLDLKSLYPMSMKTINAGPETKDPDGELTAPNGVSFRNDEDAVVVEIIDEMLEERERYKELRDKHPPDSKLYKIYDRKQSAIKVVMNTLYGVMGWDRFRLQDEDVGSAVTSTGRDVIKFTEDCVEEMGYESVYGDTDSVMIHLGDVSSDVLEDKEAVSTVLDEHDCDTIDEFRDKTEDKHGQLADQDFIQYLSVLTVGFKMEERINEKYDKFAKEELNADEHFFQIEFEKLYRRFFQAGKKKRYAGHITWKEGKIKDSLDIVGFEYQRSDYSTIAKQLMKRVFNHILRGGGLQDISEDVNDTITELKEGQCSPDDFGIPASIGKSFEDYESETVAVKGAKYANEHFDAGIQPGDKPKRCYVERIRPDGTGDIPYPMPDRDKSRSQPCCWMDYADIPAEVVWDWEEYIDKQIKKPISRILKGTDWSWAEVISGRRQPRLGEYEFEDETEENGTNKLTVSDPDPTGGAEEDFESLDDMDKWEREEMEAKKSLEQTQEMLDGWEDETEDGREVVTATMKDSEEGVNLDDFM